MKTFQGTVRGNRIELTESLGLPDGQSVEISVERLLSEPKSPSVQMSEGLASVYEILGERFQSGHADTAARHNEHQP